MLRLLTRLRDRMQFAKSLLAWGAVPATERRLHLLDIRGGWGAMWGR